MVGVPLSDAEVLGSCFLPARDTEAQLGQLGQLSAHRDSFIFSHFLEVFHVLELLKSSLNCDLQHIFLEN